MIRFVFLLLLLAAVLYGFFWAVDRRNNGGGESSDPARPLPRGPVGPDDDEAFLRNLDLERRRTHEEPPPTPQERHDQPE
ncbi:hypothetical protein [Nocardioides marmorisolisilvae]|uniref:hypothetical protein n=1 Tax=Nocardioides marmorisolisilvae TaxID=1542737 RepID=UPI0011CD7224|nr:hypothetical protein [Nocardioides marmorisolisilvae]